MSDLYARAKAVVGAMTPKDWHIKNEVEIDGPLDDDERYVEWMAEITAKHEDETEYCSLMMGCYGLHCFAKPNADGITFLRNTADAALAVIEAARKMYACRQCTCNKGKEGVYCIHCEADWALRSYDVALRAHFDRDGT